MPRIMHKCLLGFACALLACVASAADTSVHNNEWWNIPYPSAFNQKLLKKEQPRIVVKGHLFINEKTGRPFIFRGASIADPAKLAAQGHWNEKIFKELAAWGANAVRIPVHPLPWREKGQAWYFERLDEAVQWANYYGLYLIIDWHSIGNIKDELFQHPMYDTSLTETRRFWKDISIRYHDVPAMAVYEIFNEPTTGFLGTGGGLGTVAWDEWLMILESMVDLIRSYDSKVIPLVAGFNWAYDVVPFKNAPLRREGIAYAVHPYPMKAKPEKVSDEAFYKLWEEQWGFLAKTHPMIATEIGWVKPDGYGAHIPVNDDGSYGPRISHYLKKTGISWTAWVFDPSWSPRMIEDWDFTPSEQGAHFRKVMLELKKSEK